VLIEGKNLFPLFLKKGEGRRFKNNHPWVFSNELKEIPKIESGSLVSLYDFKGEFLAIGYFNPHTLIAFRKLSSEKFLEKEFIYQRILKAKEMRDSIYEQSEAKRVVFGECDGLPGLIVDYYGDVITIQILTAGMERLKEEIVDSIKRIFHPQSIILRNDPSVRELEGLIKEKMVIYGENSTIRTRFSGIDFEFDGLKCQKTGLFLDQRENIKSLDKFDFEGKRVLDLFCYFGSSGLYSLKKGAKETIFVDSSEYAIEIAKESEKRNNLKNGVFIKGDVLDVLKDFSKKRFDFIFSDPPSFAKSSKQINEAIKGYTNLNSMCFKLLKEEGILIASTCSYHISLEMFFESLRQSAIRSKRDAKLLFYGTQSFDHPALLNFPESLYLKTIFFQAI
jgi:23S rRNA (cytosine1962-C5)-methyltransferase